MKQGEIICRSKLAYDSEDLAESGADFDLLRYGTKMRVYKCRFCLKYHLTSKPYVVMKKKALKAKSVPKAKKTKKVESQPQYRTTIIQVINWKRVPGDMKEPKITIVNK